MYESSAVIVVLLPYKSLGMYSSRFMQASRLSRHGLHALFLTLSAIEAYTDGVNAPSTEWYPWSRIECSIAAVQAIESPSVTIKSPL